MGPIRLTIYNQQIAIIAIIILLLISRYYLAGNIIIKYWWCLLCAAASVYIYILYNIIAEQKGSEVNNALVGKR